LQPADHTTFQFDGFTLDAERGCLCDESGEIELRPKSFGVLRYLVASAGRLVTKDELISAVWSKVTVSDESLTRCISDIRLALRDKEQRIIKTVARRGYRFEAHPLRYSAAATNNLPAETVSFLGRDRDLIEVGALLSEARLITISGVGGVGKTQLAIHVAREVLRDFPGGVWLVEFAAVGEPRAVGHVVAGVLGIAQQAGETIEQGVVSSLAGRRLLMILDNCEHLIDAIAALAHDILSNCPQVSLLATSREALMVGGERIWPLRPLEFAEGIASPAVALFVDRARAAAPNFDLGSEDDAVCEICRRLDGIPLAIELAAARIRSMSAAQIRDRLHERFRFLTGGSRPSQERHQTLRRAVDWSYALLSPVERLILVRASVFAGGFTLEAAERVCSGGEINQSDILDILDSLSRKSLITTERSVIGVRFGLLETIRQFAEEQLLLIGESERIRHRHALFFAEEAESHLKIWFSPQQLVAYQWLDREIDNLRSAFRWAKGQEDVDLAVRIASNIGDMARFRLRDEAASWASDVVDAARRVGHRRLIFLLNWAGSSAWGQGRLDAAKRFDEEAISLLSDDRFDQLVWAFTDLAMIASYQGDAARAVEVARMGAEHPADRNGRFCLAVLLAMQAASDAQDEAIQTADDVVAEVKSAGIPCAIIIALGGKGTAFAESNPALAFQALEEAATIARQSGNRMLEIMFIPLVALQQAASGDTTGALRSFLHMLELWGRSFDLTFVSAGISALIVIFEKLGWSMAAANLCGALTRTGKSTGFVSGLPDAIARVRKALGGGPFEAAHRRGAAMAHHEVVDYVTDQIQQILVSVPGELTARKFNALPSDQ
jgi:predicted ATPase/DNA-binding winged helix-turn-helix (wHTH) protein